VRAEGVTENVPARDSESGPFLLSTKPDASDPNPHTQEVYLGVTLNLQRVVDELLAPAGRVDASVGTGTLHFATEVLQVPFTTLRFNVATRATPDDVAQGATGTP
jgi:hypothetical protein